MERLCLIGLGTITKRYIKGLSKSNKKMLADNCIDGVIISTPPKSKCYNFKK